MTSATTGELPRELPTRVRFIIKDVTLASQCGVSSVHVRSITRRFGKALDVEIECFLSTRHVLFLLTAPEESAQRGHVVQLRSADFDLGRIGKLTELVQRLEDGELDIDQANASLDAVHHEAHALADGLNALGHRPRLSVGSVQPVDRALVRRTKWRLQQHTAV